MMTLTIAHYLVLGAVLFTIGLCFVFIAGLTVFVGPENQPITLQGCRSERKAKTLTFSNTTIAVKALR